MASIYKNRNPERNAALRQIRSHSDGSRFSQPCFGSQRPWFRIAPSGRINDAAPGYLFCRLDYTGSKREANSSPETAMVKIFIHAASQKKTEEKKLFYVRVTEMTSSVFVIFTFIILINISHFHI